MIILGISAYYHDSAAALVQDGADRRRRAGRALHPQKARFSFPSERGQIVLAEAGHLACTDVDHVVFYDKPFLKFERLLETYLAFAPRGFTSFRKAMPVWISEKLFQKNLLLKELNAIDDRTRNGGKAALHRASPQPRGVRLLSFAV